jgi:hypothetical protein
MEVIIAGETISLVRIPNHTVRAPELFGTRGVNYKHKVLNQCGLKSFNTYLLMSLIKGYCPLLDEVNLL